MTILLLLIPLGLGLLGCAVAVFVWAVRAGQFEDLEGEGMRILFDETDAARISPLAASSEREARSRGARGAHSGGTR